MVMALFITFFGARKSSVNDAVKTLLSIDNDYTHATGEELSRIISKA